MELKIAAGVVTKVFPLRATIVSAGLALVGCGPSQQIYSEAPPNDPPLATIKATSRYGFYGLYEERNSAFLSSINGRAIAPKTVPFRGTTYGATEARVRPGLVRIGLAIQHCSASAGSSTNSCRMACWPDKIELNVASGQTYLVDGSLDVDARLFSIRGVTLKASIVNAATGKVVWKETRKKGPGFSRQCE